MGLPSVLITAMPSLALNVGANRIMEGNAIKYPVGLSDHSLPDEDRRYRQNVVTKALDLLAERIDGQTVWTVDTNEGA